VQATGRRKRVNGPGAIPGAVREKPATARLDLT
jgi:hypothetical protein